MIVVCALARLAAVHGAAAVRTPDDSAQRGFGVAVAVATALAAAAASATAASTGSAERSDGSARQRP